MKVVVEFDRSITEDEIDLIQNQMEDDKWSLSLLFVKTNRNSITLNSYFSNTPSVSYLLRQFSRLQLLAEFSVDVTILPF